MLSPKNETQLMEEVNAAWGEYQRRVQAKEKGLEAAFQNYVVALHAYTSFLKNSRMKDGAS